LKHIFSQAMIIKLCFILEIFFIAQSTSFELDSKFSSLVDDINAAASEAGIEPFARAKSIQEIKSMKALKDIQEITAMKEIKSIQEVPDNVAEKFIDDNDLQPIDSIADSREISSEDSASSEEPMLPSISSEDSASSEEPLRIIRDSDCGDAEAMRDMLENVKMMAQDMVELLDNFDLKHSRDLEPDSGEEPIGLPDGEEIVSTQEVKKIEEVKSITPIKSIQEVVGIYPLTEELAQKLKRLNAARGRR